MSLKQALTDTQAYVHMEEWGQIANEVGFEALKVAVQDVLRNGSEWFPSVKAIRDLAGLNQSDRAAVEADKAWEFLQRHLREWGVDGLDFYCGRWEHPPDLPPRIKHALRAVGGLQAVNQVKIDSLPFMRRDYIEAYRLAGLDPELRLQLTAGVEGNCLVADIKLMAKIKRM